MLSFRCYNCWTPFRYEGIKNHEYCTECGAKLYTGELSEGTKEAAVENPSTHKIMKSRLSLILMLRKGIYKGTVETIAGEYDRRKPDDIYYYKKDKDENEPIIFEVETCESLSNSQTIKQCKLFAETAENIDGEFVLVVPKDCDGEKGEKLAKKMLNENRIDLNKVLILSL